MSSSSRWCRAPRGRAAWGIQAPRRKHRRTCSGDRLRRPPVPTTSRSGSTHRAPRASPRALCCARTPIPTGPRSSTAPRYSASARLIFFSAAKIFFAYGLGNALTFPLSVGASVLLMARRPTPDAVFQRWIAKKPTIFFGAPTGYAAMLASPKLPKRDEVSLRLCSRRGAAEGSRRPLLRALRPRDHRRHQFDEMLHIFISNRPGAGGLRHDGAAGARLRKVELSRAEDGRLVAGAARSATLLHPRPQLGGGCTGARPHQVARDVPQGGWSAQRRQVRTRDADGERLTSMAGRSRRHAEGERPDTCLPSEVEATLHEASRGTGSGIDRHSGRRERACTRSKAFVVLKTGTVAVASAGDHELKAFVKGELAPYKYPRLLGEFIAELPKTATGKIQRFKSCGSAEASKGKGATACMSAAAAEGTDLRYRVRMAVPSALEIPMGRRGRADHRPSCTRDWDRSPCGAIFRPKHSRMPLPCAAWCTRGPDMASPTPQQRPMNAGNPTSCTARRTRCCPAFARQDRGIRREPIWLLWT